MDMVRLRREGSGVRGHAQPEAGRVPPEGVRVRSRRMQQMSHGSVGHSVSVGQSAVRRKRGDVLFTATMNRKASRCLRQKTQLRHGSL